MGRIKESQSYENKDEQHYQLEQGLSRHGNASSNTKAFNIAEVILQSLMITKMTIIRETVPLKQ